MYRTPFTEKPYGSDHVMGANNQTSSHHAQNGGSPHSAQAGTQFQHPMEMLRNQTATAPGDRHFSRWAYNPRAPSAPFEYPEDFAARQSSDPDQLSEPRMGGQTFGAPPQSSGGFPTYQASAHVQSSEPSMGGDQTFGDPPQSSGGFTTYQASARVQSSEPRYLPDNEYAADNEDNRYNSGYSAPASQYSRPYQAQNTFDNHPNGSGYRARHASAPVQTQNSFDNHHHAGGYSAHPASVPYFAQNLYANHQYGGGYSAHQAPASISPLASSSYSDSYIAYQDPPQYQAQSTYVNHQRRCGHSGNQGTVQFQTTESSNFAQIADDQEYGENPYYQQGSEVWGPELNNFTQAHGNQTYGDAFNHHQPDAEYYGSESNNFAQADGEEEYGDEFSHHQAGAEQYGPESNNFAQADGDEEYGDEFNHHQPGAEYYGTESNNFAQADGEEEYGDEFNHPQNIDKSPTATMDNSSNASANSPTNSEASDASPPPRMVRLPAGLRPLSQLQVKAEQVSAEIKLAMTGNGLTGFLNSFIAENSTFVNTLFELDIFLGNLHRNLEVLGLAAFQDIETERVKKTYDAAIKSIITMTYDLENIVRDQGNRHRIRVARGHVLWVLKDIIAETLRIVRLMEDQVGVLMLGNERIGRPEHLLTRLRHCKATWE